MNAQQIFNTVAAHLFAQGKQSKNLESGCCLYRGPGDTMCAVGCLIPDDVYDKRMENWSVRTVISRYEALYRLGPHERLLDLLQTTHDHDQNWASTPAMHGALSNVAENQSLDFSVASTFKFADR